jgi:hypothetical protein
MRDVAIAGPQPGVEAGQPSYSVRVTPTDRGGLVGGVALAWDAVRGTPIRVGVYARGSDAPVLELRATDIQYGPIDASAFAVKPPAGAKVNDVATGDRGHADVERRRPRLSEVGFDVVAPGELAGRQRTELHAARFGDDVGAVAVYGRGLDAIVVVERPEAKAAAPKAKAESGWDHHGGNAQVELPTTDLNGARAQVLETPLGSAVQWSRAGVTYVVAGSVTRSVAEAAARGIR